MRALDSRCSRLPSSSTPRTLDEPRQRQPLQDQRGEDDRVGEEDDEVALREGAAAVDRLRDGQRRGQRHRAAHAGPRRRWPGTASATAGSRSRTRRESRRGSVGGREDPQEADDDDRAPTRRPRRTTIEPVDSPLMPSMTLGQLQPDEHEEHGVEDEDEDLPHREGLDPGRRRDELRRAPAEVDAGRHRGQDRRDAERLGRQVGEVRRDQRDRDLGRRVVERLAQPGDDVADGDADRDADDRVEDEAPARLGQREAPADHGGDRELVGDERRRVVDQRLALDDRHVAPRRADARGDRRRRDGIGRRHDGAEHERRLPTTCRR